MFGNIYSAECSSNNYWHTIVYCIQSTYSKSRESISLPPVGNTTDRTTKINLYHAFGVQKRLTFYVFYCQKLEYFTHHFLHSDQNGEIRKRNFEFRKALKESLF